MSRVYLVERTAFTVNPYRTPAGFGESWSDAGHDRVPVAAFSNRADAEATALRLTLEDQTDICPARLGDYELPVEPTQIVAVIRRYGLTPPDFQSRAADDAADVFRNWWRTHGPVCPPSLARDLWALVADKQPLYRVETRTLED